MAQKNGLVMCMRRQSWFLTETGLVYTTLREEKKKKTETRAKKCFAAASIISNASRVAFPFCPARISSLRIGHGELLSNCAIAGRIIRASMSFQSVATS